MFQVGSHVVARVGVPAGMQQQRAQRAAHMGGSPTSAAATDTTRTTRLRTNQEPWSPSTAVQNPTQRHRSRQNLQQFQKKPQQSAQHLVDQPASQQPDKQPTASTSYSDFHADLRAMCDDLERKQRDKFGTAWSRHAQAPICSYEETVTK